MNFLFRVLRRFWFSLFGFNKFFFCIESVLFFCIQTKRSHSWESATPTIPNESYQNPLPLHPPSIYRLPCRPTYNKCWGASTCEKPKLRKKPTISIYGFELKERNVLHMVLCSFPEGPEYKTGTKCVLFGFAKQWMVEIFHNLRILK